MSHADNVYRTCLWTFAIYIYTTCNHDFWSNSFQGTCSAYLSCTSLVLPLESLHKWFFFYPCFSSMNPYFTILACLLTEPSVNSWKWPAAYVHLLVLSLSVHAPFCSMHRSIKWIHYKAVDLTFTKHLLQVTILGACVLIPVFDSPPVNI